MKKVISFLLVVTYCIVCISFQINKVFGEQDGKNMKTIGSFNGSDPAFVSYARKNSSVEEVKITRVVAYSDKTSKQNPVSYASYAVDDNESTKWQSVSLSKSEEVAITFSFEGNHALSSIRILSPRFPKKVKVTYTTETDDESKQVEVDIEEDGNDKRIIFLKGLVANSVTLTASGIDRFELSEVEFFTVKNVLVSETIPQDAHKISNPYNSDAYKVSDKGSMTFRFKRPRSVFKIEIKAKGLKGLDIYYSNDGQETLLRQVAGLAGVSEIQYFEFDAVHTDTFTLKGINECEIYNIKFYEWDTDSTSWAATDGLGRRVELIDDAKRQNKEVGIFYFFAHSTETKGGKHYDVTRILEEIPDAMENGRGFGPYMTLHWWGEPAFGFYTQTDEWVLRKDAQMLSDAGVDFLIFDLSNFKADNPATGYKKEILLLCEVFMQVRKEGGKTPKFMFFMPPLAPNAVAAFDFWWDNMYKDGLYEELWYKWDNGKPVALTFRDQIEGTRYVDFFEIRNVQRAISPYYTSYKDDWQWISAYPQGYGYSDEYPIEAMNASPAQNVTLNNADEEYQKYKFVGYHIGFSIGYDKNTRTTITRGRDFMGGAPARAEDLERAIYEGWNFREQLNHVLEKDPRITFITGWNEWTMYRIPGNPGVNGVTDPDGFFFWDQFNYRYNRDIQPMAYHYKDATYYQMVEFIRRYKGQTHPKGAKPMTMSMNGFDDWLDVDAAYYDDIGDITHRDAHAFNNTLKYTNTSGRNDIISAKVSYDSDYVYFYVKTREAMTPYTDPSWMRLFIRTEGKGWEGYDYILNKKSPTEAKAFLEKFEEGSWDTTVVGEVDYELKGREMQVSIPRKMLGLTNTVRFEFKWHDNMQEQGEALDFTTSGDSAPNGRFNYVFSDVSEVERETSLRTLFITIIIISLLTIVSALVYEFKFKKKEV